MCKRQNNYKPDNKREKRGDIILLSETIMNSIDWQKSITKTLSNFEHIFNLCEVARPLSNNMKGGYHINCPFGYVGRGRVRVVTHGLNLPRHGTETALN